MVLDDASNPPPSDFTSESTPTSDRDPYAGSNAEFIESRPSSYLRVQDSTPPIYVNLANLPRPFLIASNPKLDAKIFRHYGDQIKKNVEASTKLVQRPLTQEEADALAFNFATLFRISSYGAPLGLAFAGLQFIRTMRTFRFPFWSPFKEGGRLSPDRFGPLRGRSARWAWHTSRGAAYGMFTGIFLGPTISGVYAISHATAARHTDPRLKDITEAVHKRGQQLRQQKDGAATQQRQSMEETGRANQRGESPEMSRKRWEARVEEARLRRPSGAAAPVDDMSPTGGAFADEISSQSDGFVSDGWQAQQEMLDSRGQVDTTSTATSTAPPTNSSPPSSSRSQRSSSQPSQQSSPSKESGSAWDRLRQDAMSSPNQSKSSSSAPSRSQNGNSSQSSSSGSESFSFSPGEEDKQLAKSEAQKEFDARIEREREGKDFEESGRGGKRW